MKSKKAAMEMSVGTIVTIVLLMSVLVLGLFLVQNIFKSAKGAVDLTDQQLQSEIEKLFSDDSTKLVLYPTSKQITLKVGDTDAVGIGIRNIVTGDQTGTSFRYTIFQTSDTCGLNERANSFIVLNRERENIQVPISDLRSMKATIQIPEGVPNCLISYTVDIFRQGESDPYRSDDFTLETKA